MLVGAHGVTFPNSQTSANAVLESYWACPRISWWWSWGCLWELMGLPLPTPKHRRTRYLRAAGPVPGDASGSFWGCWGMPLQSPRHRRTRYLRAVGHVLGCFWGWSWGCFWELLGLLGPPPPISQTSPDAVLESCWACPWMLLGMVLGMLLGAPGAAGASPSHLPNVAGRGT